MRGGNRFIAFKEHATPCNRMRHVFRLLGKNLLPHINAYMLINHELWKITYQKPYKDVRAYRFPVVTDRVYIIYSDG